jgi:cytokinin dehydrogenase
MLERNRRLLELALGAGGARYPIGTVAYGPQDWQAHYSERWPHLAELKRRYDPARILTPGHQVFTE